MTMPAAAVPAPSVATGRDGPYVDWAAILAGAAVATALSIVMLTFGSAIGLGFVSPFAGEGWSATGFALAAGLWFVWVQVSGYLAGGYVSGRLRRPLGDANAHEVEVRDAAHGLLVWATGVILAGVIAASGVSGTATAVGAAATTAGEAGEDVADAGLGLAAERAFRRTDGLGLDADAVEEAGRIMASAIADGGLSPAERQYLAARVAGGAGLSPQDAEARIAEVQRFVATAIDDAQAAAEAARVATVIAAFLVGATLAAGAAAASVAAQAGGRHRDDNAVFAFLSQR